MEELKQLKKEVEEIKEQLGGFNKTGRFTFYKLLQMLDGRNIQTGRTTGTKIGLSSSEKIGLWGTTPVDQPETVADAIDAASVILRCNDIIDRLQEIGIIK